MDRLAGAAGDPRYTVVYCAYFLPGFVFSFVGVGFRFGFIGYLAGVYGQ